MWLLAQQVDTGTDPTEWIQFGALGLVVLALLTGWLWAKPAVDRILEENRVLREQLHEQRDRQAEALIAEVHALRSELREERSERRRRPSA